MLPFGETILLWRLDRGLTQGELARRSGIPRPNLSAIERGKREVSLRTIRSLALALDIRPGILVDGIPPQEGRRRFSREALERIADAVLSGMPLKDAGERALADRLKSLVASRLGAAHPLKGRPPRIGRRSERAWLSSIALHSPEEIQSLANRILERRP